jgi:hypothetical protein
MRWLRFVWGGPKVARVRNKNNLWVFHEKLSFSRPCDGFTEFKYILLTVYKHYNKRFYKKYSFKFDHSTPNYKSHRVSVSKNVDANNNKRCLSANKVFKYWILPKLGSQLIAERKRSFVWNLPVFPACLGLLLNNYIGLLWIKLIITGGLTVMFFRLFYCSDQLCLQLDLPLFWRLLCVYKYPDIWFRPYQKYEIMQKKPMFSIF